MFFERRFLHHRGSVSRIQQLAQVILQKTTAVLICDLHHKDYLDRGSVKENDYRTRKCAGFNEQTRAHQRLLAHWRRNGEERETGEMTGKRKLMFLFLQFTVISH